MYNNFHFCQAVMNAVKRMGYKEEYERVTTDPVTRQKVYTPIRTWVRGLMMLAIVPAREVRDSLFSLLDDMPDDLNNDDPLVYFQTTWIEGISIIHREKRSWECQVPSSSLLMELLRQDPCSA